MKKLLVASLVLGSLASNAQTAFGDYLDNINVISTAMPMLNIGPDARGGGMANVGVSSSPDAYSMFWNPAKLAFLGKGKKDVGLMYNPWLRRIVPDVDLSAVSYVTGLTDRSGLGVSLRYFSLGDITFRNDQGQEQGTFNPYEMAVDVGYAMKLSDNLSAAIALRYAFSDLTQGQTVDGLQTQAGQTFAADIAFYYQSKVKNLSGGSKGQWTGGLNISNIGAKVNYSNSGQGDFIPTNLRLGAGYNYMIDKYNRVHFMFDVNKLLVPTAPVREQNDENGNNIPNEIIAGKDDNVGVIAGIIQSFDPSAKPGGSTELWREFIYNVAAEYWYNDMFAVRAGYQHENQYKGNRRYYTMGLGLKYNIIGFDFSYLFPADQSVKSPLESTLRFSMTFDFGAVGD